MESCYSGHLRCCTVSIMAMSALAMAFASSGNAIARSVSHCILLAAKATY